MTDKNLIHEQSRTMLDMNSNGKVTLNNLNNWNSEENLKEPEVVQKKKENGNENENGNGNEERDSSSTSSESSVESSSRFWSLIFCCARFDF